MKRRILAICCLALFLLYTCTALADQQVRLEQYGVSFTVPDGMTWVPYQEASADIQAVMDTSGACGMFNSSATAFAQLVLYNEPDSSGTDFSVLSDDEILTFGRALASDTAISNSKVSVYNAGKTKWYKLTGSQSGSRITIYFTLKHGLGIVLASYNVLNLSSTHNKNIETLLSSFTLPAKTLLHHEYFGLYALIIYFLFIQLSCAICAHKLAARKHYSGYFWTGFLLGIWGLLYVAGLPVLHAPESTTEQQSAAL